MIQLKNEKNGEWQKMNSSHVFRKEFPNGWLVDSGFASFENIEKASEVFKYIGEVLKW